LVDRVGQVEFLARTVQFAIEAQDAAVPGLILVSEILDLVPYPDGVAAKLRIRDAG